MEQDRQAQQSPKEATTIGQLTFTDLSDTADFFRAPLMDAWHVSRPPLSPKIARMSAELAADGYELHIAPWRDAGWADCVFVVEDKIVSLGLEDDTRMASIEAAWKRRRVRALIRGVNPINDLMRAIRQLMVTDLGKSLVMTHAAEGGRAIVAVSFVGTTQKYFDWFSNFKFHSADGMHYGFLQLAKQFEAQAARVLLPRLAQMLGEETFSLADAIAEAARPDGRLVFWVSGHSQGGAIAQTFAYLLMARGVPCTSIHGYTFAAPSVAMCDGSIDPGQYPLYNIINSDDLVPRVGAQVRLGVDLVFRPGDAFRAAHYRVDAEHAGALQATLFAGRQVQSMREGICFLIALTRFLGELDAQGNGQEAREAKEAMPYASLLRRLNLSLPEVTEFFEGKLLTQYREMTGALPDGPLLAFYAQTLRDMADSLGVKGLVHAMTKGLGAPHRMRPDKHDERYEPPYIAIARKCLHLCRQGVWMPDAPARCLDAHGRQLLPDPLARRPLLDAADAPMALPQPTQPQAPRVETPADDI